MDNTSASRLSRVGRLQRRLQTRLNRRLRHSTTARVDTICRPTSMSSIHLLDDRLHHNQVRLCVAAVIAKDSRHKSIRERNGKFCRHAGSKVELQVQNWHTVKSNQLVRQYEISSVHAALASGNATADRETDEATDSDREKEKWPAMRGSCAYQLDQFIHSFAHTDGRTDRQHISSVPRD